MIKSLGWVVLVATLTCLPAGVFLATGTNAPIWYVALASITGAFGMGVLSSAVGGLVLVARRDRPEGRLKTVLITTVVAGLFVSQAVIYPLLRFA